MIHRLSKLEVEGFRMFRELELIPLDADVVLIYGPNGCGKTGIISAIEYAITGDVAHLHAFSDDYPRCLRHVRATGRTQVTLHYQPLSGELLFQTMDLSNKSPKPTNITSEERRFFLDRSYLSQSLLGRLLENYQAVEKGQPEQPLVRFIRELIGLDLLENLTAGLHEAGDVRRMEKVSTALVTLTSEESAISQEKDKLDRQQMAESALWKDHVNAVQALAADYGDPVKDAPWNVSGLRLRSKALAASVVAEEEFQSLRRLERTQGRLDRALGFIHASHEKDVDGVQGLRSQLTFVETRRSEIEMHLSPIVEAAATTLREAQLMSSEASTAPDIVERLVEIESTIARAIPRYEEEIRTAGETEEELKSLEAQGSRLTAEIKGLEEVPLNLATQQRARVAVFRAALEGLSGDTCPVCGRDYSELKAGDLRSRIALELDGLGGDIERLEKAANHRAQLTTEEAQMRRRLVALKERVEINRPQVDITRDRLERLKKCQETISSERPVRAQWGQLRAERDRIHAGLATAEIRESQRAEGIKEISDITRELGLPEEDGPPNAESLAEKVSGHLRAQIDSTQAKKTARNRLLDALESAERISTRLERIGSSLRKLEIRSEKAANARQNAKDALEKARLVARAAGTVKKDLLQQVFNETLNGLWNDLFRRLVRWERFTPRLGEPTYSRGKILATIQGVAKGEKPFEQLASVLSTGNLNTAALSLFLSLHLVEQPRHHILVLDDPIQSMDDVHVVQLAGVLRAIVHEARRQLVIAVHERALYEYLCLELGPTRETDSLMAIELIRESEDGDVTVHHDRRVWKQDLVKFGA